MTPPCSTLTQKDGLNDAASGRPSAMIWNLLFRLWMFWVPLISTLTHGSPGIPNKSSYLHLDLGGMTFDCLWCPMWGDETLAYIYISQRCKTLADGSRSIPHHLRDHCWTCALQLTEYYTLHGCTCMHSRNVLFCELISFHTQWKYKCICAQGLRFSVSAMPSWRTSLIEAAFVFCCERMALKQKWWHIQFAVWPCFVLRHSLSY